MHNSFENLQKRCKNYILKQRLKMLLPLVLVVMVATFLGYFFMQEKTYKVAVLSAPTKNIGTKKIQETDINITPEIPVSKNVKKIKIATVEKPKKVVKDVTYFMEVDDSYVALEKEIVPIKKKNISKKKEKKSKNKQKKIYQKVKKEISKKQEINMSVKSISSIKDMLSIYKKEKKYDLALKIGQKYYEQHKYSKSLFWSKEANLLNHRAEGAWILYAKSEYAKGNKERAIKILNLYRGNTNSPDADSLVMKWMEDIEK